MSRPTLKDYMDQLRRLFELYQQDKTFQVHRGHPYTYERVSLILFFVIMTLRRVFRFKAQRRWLETHPEMLPELGFDKIPHRTTLSRRFKACYELVRDFLRFVRQRAEDLDESFSGKELFEDKSLFKAFGPVWHRKDQFANRVPAKLRNLDKEATWSKSSHHGWVYGYGLHLTVSIGGLPRDMAVETASVPESKAIEEKAKDILSQRPYSVTGDNAYCKLTRARAWATKGVALLCPASKLKGKTSRSAAYQSFIKEPENQFLLKARNRAVEPTFNLITEVLGLDRNHKQLPMKGRSNVRSLLALGSMIVLLAMVVNSIWELPTAEVSHIISVFT